MFKRVILTGAACLCATLVSIAHSAAQTTTNGAVLVQPLLSAIDWARNTGAAKTVHHGIMKS